MTEASIFSNPKGAASANTARVIIAPPLPGYDQDRRAAEFHYMEADPTTALRFFTGLRHGNLLHCRTLAAAQWQ